MNVFNSRERNLILAHRGYSTKACENTMEAFDLCVENSIDAIEFDVHLSKDNQLVIIHDHNLLRLTGLDAQVEDLTYEELSKLQVKTKFGKGNIPLLNDLFKKHNNKLYYDIELKAKGYKNELLAQMCWDLIREYSLQEYCLISSFNPFVVASFNKISKRALPTAVIYSLDKEVPPLLRRGWGRFIAKPTHLKPHYQLVTKKVIKKRFPVITWTVDDVKLGKEFLDMGVLAIISNDPKLFLD
ncbi:MAG: glycerophosphodiester phosphodiesterase family protein [Sphaerochaetaceae bacterium]|jgi:glycerophosphoryl diester phosphodiesterase